MAIISTILKKMLIWLVKKKSFFQPNLKNVDSSQCAFFMIFVYSYINCTTNIIWKNIKYDWSHTVENKMNF